jgi:hypothetical protein
MGPQWLVVVVLVLLVDLVVVKWSKGFGWDKDSSSLARNFQPHGDPLWLSGPTIGAWQLRMPMDSDLRVRVHLRFQNIFYCTYIEDASRASHGI